jgi:hypothetical protein
MTTFGRRLILLALGVLGGAAVWPVAEEILFLQRGFSSYLGFLAALGALVGALMGAVFGAAEGITSRVKERIPAGMILGAGIGLPGGAAGLLAGQAALWLIAGAFLQNHLDFRWVVLPVSRAIGWAVLGVFVGAGEGVRALSPKKTVVGALGGLVGGLAGGFVIEYLRLLVPGLAVIRLVGLVVLGAAIAAFYGIIERGMSFGVLRVLTGELRGKEYLINQRRLRIGRGRRNEIALSSYEGLADRQAQIVIRRGEPVLVNLEPRLPMLVNEQKAAERVLKFGDVIMIGPAKIYYKYG